MNPEDFLESQDATDAVAAASWLHNPAAPVARLSQARVLADEPEWTGGDDDDDEEGEL